MSNDWSQGGNGGNGNGGGHGYGAPPGAQGYGPPQGYGQQQQQQGYGPPQGYAPPQTQHQYPYVPPQQAMQPQYPPQQQYGAAPMPMPMPMAPSGAATAMGVPLEPGERVIFFDQPNYSTDKILLWVFGVMFLVILVGIIFIVMAIRFDKSNPRGNFVTNYRVVHVSGKGEVISVPLREINDLDVERQRANSGGGGLIGAAISAGVTAVADNMANKKAKHDPKFWNRAIAVIMVTSQGRISFASRKAKQLGVLLSNGLPNLAAIEQYPSVPFQP